MHKYRQLVQTVLHDGGRKENTRGGVDTIGVFNYNYEHDVGLEGIPLLTTKKISWKNIVIENLWFLSGEPTVDFLHKHNVHFWDPWVQEDGTVPSAYGNFWRRFDNGTSYLFEDMLKTEKLVPNLIDPIPQSPQRPMVVDQVAWALAKLEKNPMDRQVCITSWDPRNVRDSGLPPCHVMHILNIQADGRLNLHLTQRSCDTGLGLPYNMAGYGGFLLPLYARFLGREVGIFAHSIADLHIYTDNLQETMPEYDHVPALEEQLTRACKPLPQIVIDESIRDLDDIEHIVKSDMTTEQIMDLFQLEGYDPWPAVKMKVAV